MVMARELWKWQMAEQEKPAGVAIAQVQPSLPMEAVMVMVIVSASPEMMSPPPAALKAKTGVLQIFNPKSLTEDYEIGIRLGKRGARQIILIQYRTRWKGFIGWDFEEAES